ncbi:hypothetical protein HDU76_003481 [Blyttiomyces sp. JEL0837]|nr:hypothetical protein HDU76_003481 [Blyttiomyces sp. JEL0837]
MIALLPARTDFTDTSSVGYLNLHNNHGRNLTFDTASLITPNHHVHRSSDSSTSRKDHHLHASKRVSSVNVNSSSSMQIAIDQQPLNNLYNVTSLTVDNPTTLATGNKNSRLDRIRRALAPYSRIHSLYVDDDIDRSGLSNAGSNISTYRVQSNRYDGPHHSKNMMKSNKEATSDHDDAGGGFGHLKRRIMMALGDYIPRKESESLHSVHLAILAFNGSNEKKPTSTSATTSSRNNQNNESVATWLHSFLTIPVPAQSIQLQPPTPPTVPPQHHPHPTDIATYITKLICQGSKGLRLLRDLFPGNQEHTDDLIRLLTVVKLIHDSPYLQHPCFIPLVETLRVEGHFFYKSSFELFAGLERRERMMTCLWEAVNKDRGYDEALGLLKVDNNLFASLTSPIGNEGRDNQNTAVPMEVDYQDIRDHEVPVIGSSSPTRNDSSVPAAVDTNDNSITVEPTINNTNINNTSNNTKNDNFIETVLNKTKAGKIQKQPNFHQNTTNRIKKAPASLTSKQNQHHENTQQKVTTDNNNNNKSTTPPPTKPPFCEIHGNGKHASKDCRLILASLTQFRN